MSTLTDRIIAPLSSFYADPATVEVRMARPHRVVVDRRGRGKSECEAPALNRAMVERIARALANPLGLTRHTAK